jgi:hypothetical protein
MKITNRFLMATAIVLVVGGLSACGDDDGVASVAPVALVPGTDVPVTATTSSMQAQVFVKQVVETPTATAEVAEALELGDAVLANSDTDEPEPDA